MASREYASVTDPHAAHAKPYLVISDSTARVRKLVSSLELA
jgi:hypothetical protein